MNTFKSIFPYTLETIAEYEIMSQDKLESSLSQSAIAFKHWRKTSFTERGRLMIRVADLLIEHRDEYAILITMKWGKY